MYRYAVVSVLAVVVIVLAYSANYNTKRVVHGPAKSVTVTCKDGSSYQDSLDSTEDFKCPWKSIVFNY